jgi:hypothetical protein
MTGIDFLIGILLMLGIAALAFLLFVAARGRLFDRETDALPKLEGPGGHTSPGE